LQLKKVLSVDDVISGVGFRTFWVRLPGPRCQPLDGIFWLKFIGN